MFIFNPIREKMHWNGMEKPLKIFQNQTPDRIGERDIPKKKCTFEDAKYGIKGTDWAMFSHASIQFKGQ